MLKIVELALWQAENDPAFAALRATLLSYDQTDRWRALAGLDAIVEATLPGYTGKGAPRAKVSLAALFDHLVTYRNQVIAHGDRLAAGRVSRREG